MILRDADLDQQLLLGPSRKRQGHTACKRDRHFKELSATNYLQSLPTQKHLKPVLSLKIKRYFKVSSLNAKKQRSLLLVVPWIYMKLFCLHRRIWKRHQIRRERKDLNRRSSWATWPCTDPRRKGRGITQVPPPLHPRRMRKYWSPRQRAYRFFLKDKPLHSSKHLFKKSDLHDRKYSQGLC